MIRASEVVTAELRVFTLDQDMDHQQIINIIVVFLHIIILHRNTDWSDGISINGTDGISFCNM